MTEMSAGPSNGYVLSVKCTDNMKKGFSKITDMPDIPQELREKLMHYQDSAQSQIPFSILREVQQYIKGMKGIYLHELMIDSEPVLPSYEPPPRNAELEERIQRLKLEQMNREYKKMTKNVMCGQQYDPMQSFGDEVKSVQKMMITIFNFALTVVGSFAFAYKATEYALDVPNIAVQMCSGLVVGTVVFFADLYFVMKHEMVEEGTVDPSVYDKKTD